MKKAKNYMWLILTVLAIAVLIAVPVLAMGSAQDGGEGAASLASDIRFVDMAFLILITGFFKSQFDLSNKYIWRFKAGVVVALVVALILWFQPEISALHPLVGSLFVFGKWFLSTLGTYDTVIDGAAKISGS